MEQDISTIYSGVGAVHEPPLQVVNYLQQFDFIGNRLSKLFFNICVVLVDINT